MCYSILGSWSITTIILAKFIAHVFMFVPDVAHDAVMGWNTFTAHIKLKLLFIALIFNQIK